MEVFALEAIAFAHDLAVTFLCISLKSLALLSTGC